MVCWCLVWGMTGHAAAQPPAEPPAKPPKEKEASALDRLRLPADAVIVIMDDVRKAISEMKPGSVLLSAERYQALMDKLGQLERAQAAARSESLLSVCRVAGNIKPTDADRENLELRLEIELRTEAANTLVPIPLRGFRLVRATLDGEPPIWGPDADNLSVLVKEANKTSVLVLVGQVALTKVGTERRIRLDRFPPAAITTLDLEIEEPVASANVRNGGPVRLETPTATRSRLQSGALGVLSSFELAWKAAAGGERSPTPVFAVTAQQRITVEESVAETEATLRLEVTQGSLTQLRVRLAEDATEVRVERMLLDMPHPLEVTRSAGGFNVRLPESVTASDGPVLLRWRWSQRLPRPGQPMGLGLFDLAEPKPETQTGTLAVTLPPDARARWTTYQLTKAEGRDGPGEARAPALAFRYRNQPARLDLTLEAVAEALPTVEAAWQHLVRVAPEQVQLTSELEMVRPPRTNLTEIDLRWPAGWSLSGRVLLAPGVDGINHDPRRGTLRIKLNPRVTGTLKLKLEGTLATKVMDQCDLTLPLLLAVQGEVAGRAAPLGLTRREAQVRLEAEQAEVTIESASSPGFLAAAMPTTTPARPMAWTWTLPVPTGQGSEAPPRLVFAKRPLRPRVARTAKAFLLANEWVVLLTIELRSAGVPPRALSVQLPGPWREGTQAFWQESSRDKAVARQPRPARITEAAAAATGKVTTYQIHWPVELASGARLHLEYRVPRDRADGRSSIPLANLLSDEVVEDVPCRVQVWSLCAETTDPTGVSPAWRPVPRGTAAPGTTQPEWNLEATAPKEPLVVATAKPTVTLPDLVAPRVWHDVRLLPDDAALVTSRWWIRLVRSPSLAFRWPAGHAPPTVEQAAIQGVALRDGQLAWTQEGNGQALLRVLLDPPWFDRAFELEITYRVNTAAGLPYLYSPPTLAPAGTPAVDQSRWRLTAPPASLPLVLAGPRLDQGWTWAWGLHPPRAARVMQPLATWFRGEAAAPRPESDEADAYSFSQLGSSGGVKLLLLPRLPTLVLASTVIIALGWGWRMLPLTGRRYVLAAGLVLPLIAAVWPELVYLLLYATGTGWIVLLIVLTLTSRLPRPRPAPVVIPTFVRQTTPPVAAVARPRRESSVSGQVPAAQPSGEGAER